MRHVLPLPTGGIAGGEELFQDQAPPVPGEEQDGGSAFRSGDEEGEGFLRLPERQDVFPVADAPEAL